MPEYRLTGRAKRIIAISSRYQARDPELLTDDLIDDINNMTITPREARKVLCPSRNVITQTFIIPVTEGAVTGYYFTNPHMAELSGTVPLIIFCHGEIFETGLGIPADLSEGGFGLAAEQVPAYREYGCEQDGSQKDGCQPDQIFGTSGGKDA